MGYETHICVGRVHKESFVIDDKTKGHDYFRMYAEIDLCKPGWDTETGKLCDFKEGTPVYFYAPMTSNDISDDARDTPTIEDRYGSKCYPMPINKALDALKKDNETENYRRFTWAIALLESMKDDDEGLEVIFWGF